MVKGNEKLSGGRADSRVRLLEAAEACLLRDGYAGLSTRGVADAAGMPLSQIHYHFGSKQGLVLALLEHQNEKLLSRQAATFGRDAPLSARWLQACDHLEEDLRSGYVRVLQEIIAAGYSDRSMAQAARNVLRGWFMLLTELAEEAGGLLKGSGGLNSPEVACLVGLAFLGAESMILIDMDLPVRSALRGVGHALQRLEASPEGPGDAR
ncbi:MAG TPA: TetR/AcrR family transcriptional regulator [Caulobacteraceae bacterium]|nr:TetR/AcrR family transcriptional regulator [Caulobacteraceae bacterium]